MCLRVCVCVCVRAGVCARDCVAPAFFDCARGVQGLFHDIFGENCACASVAACSQVAVPQVTRVSGDPVLATRDRDFKRLPEQV